MARLEGRDDALHPRQAVEGLHRLAVGGALIVHPPDGVQEAVLRTDARIVEAAGDRVDRQHLTALILQEQALEAVEDSHRPLGDGRRMVGGIEALARRLDAVELHLLVIEEGAEDSHGVGAAADTGDHGVGKGAGHLLDLTPCLNADDALEVADHHREGVGADHRTDAVDLVDRIFKVRLEGRVDGILEGSGAAGDADDGGAEDLHPAHVRRFLLDVHLAHVDVTLQAEQRRCGGQGHPMLTRAGLGDDLLLAHPLGEQHLSDAVVDLMGTGMVEILTLEVDLCPTDCFAEAFGVIDRGGAPHVVVQQVAQLGQEDRVLDDLLVGAGHLVHDGLEFGGDI